MAIEDTNKLNLSNFLEWYTSGNMLKGIFQWPLPLMIFVSSCIIQHPLACSMPTTEGVRVQSVSFTYNNNNNPQELKNVVCSATAFLTGMWYTCDVLINSLFYKMYHHSVLLIYRV